MHSIGGYRIIRQLGSGSRARVFLGHSGRPGPSDTVTVAVKVFGPDTGPREIQHEIDMLSRLDLAHVVRLIDLATNERGDACLILQRLVPSGLAGLLTETPNIAAGEAVTILAPIALAVDGMHQSGIAHGRLRAASVLFDPSGAPVLCGLGHSVPVEDEPRSSSWPLDSGLRPAVTPAALEADLAVARDLLGLRAMVRSVLAHVDGGSHGLGVADLLDWLDDADVRNPRFARDVGERMFELADPLPVPVGAATAGDATPIEVPSRLGGRSGSRLPSDAGAGASSARDPRRSRPGRARGGASAPWPRETAENAPPVRSASPRQRAVTPRTDAAVPGHPRAAVPPLLASPRYSGTVATPPVRTGGVDATQTYLGALGSSVIGAYGRLRETLGQVRKRIWVPAVAVCFALIAVGWIAVVPPPQAPIPDPVTSPPPVTGQPVDGSLGAHDGSPGPGATTPTGEHPSTEADAISADDPASAALALMRERSRCIGERSVLCLDGVAQADSAAWRAARDRIASIHEGAEQLAVDLARPTQAHLVERFGDSALITVTGEEVSAGTEAVQSTPASVLIIRTEAGWRIRDVWWGSAG